MVCINFYLDELIDIKMAANDPPTVNKNITTVNNGFARSICMKAKRKGPNITAAAIIRA